jgi:assimilatory nitrate reductase catalytic subunit
MPPMMQYFSAAVSRGARFVVVDPRRSLTAESATHHLAITPGTDGVLAYGLLHILIQEGLIDRTYIAERTEGFERTRALAATYWPSRVERSTGVWEKTLLEIAQMIGFAKKLIILTGRGPEQQSQGVNNALAYINLALAVGAVGRPGSGYGTITGQGNGQGGREHGQKADQLPGYRSIVDPAARRHMAEVWDVPEETIPGAGMHAVQLFSSLGKEKGVRALFVVGSNPVVSAPNADAVKASFAALDFLVVSDFFLSETATYADVVLPSMQWAEEDGTMTNLEGRVIHRRAAVAPPAGVKSDLEVLCTLAAQLGEGSRFAYKCAAQVFDELRRATKGGPADYSGITYDRIDREDGVFWPCPSEDHPGTPRLFRETFPTVSGRARFVSADPITPAEEPDAEFPLFLNTGRVLAHYQTRTQTRRVAQLEQMTPRAVAQIHPTTATRYGLRQDGEVTLVTRRGRSRFAVEVTPSIRQDTVFVPFHWDGEESANRLTNPVVDPVSKMPEFKVCAVRIETKPSEEA